MCDGQASLSLSPVPICGHVPLQSNQSKSAGAIIHVTLGLDMVEAQVDISESST